MILIVLFVASTEKMIANKGSKVLIILFTSDFYRYYYGLNLASTYKAINKNVTLFYSGYSVNFLLKNWKNFDGNKVNRKFKNKNMPNYQEMLNLCFELKVKFYFCRTALEFLNLCEDNFLESISIKSASLYQVVDKHKKDQTIFI